jgi:hypothetical protein
VSASPKDQAQLQQLAAAEQSLQDVHCSANGGGTAGPVDGEQVDLIAVASKAGRVGCTEAFTRSVR